MKKFDPLKRAYCLKQCFRAKNICFLDTPKRFHGKTVGEGGGHYGQPDGKYPFFANFLTRDSYVYLDCDNSWNLQHVFQSGACEVSGSPMPGSKNQSLMNNHDFVVVSLRIVTIELWTNENNHTS